VLMLKILWEKKEKAVQFQWMLIVQIRLRSLKRKFLLMSIMNVDPREVTDLKDMKKKRRRK
jgi:hypothetical protein